jgi:hypothetical protein
MLRRANLPRLALAVRNDKSDITRLEFEDEILDTKSRSCPASTPGHSRSGGASDSTALTQSIARGTGIWITRVSDLVSRVQIESGTATWRDDPQKLASLLITCWYGAIIRRKAEPSLKPQDEFLPFFIRSGVL